MSANKKSSIRFLLILGMMAMTVFFFAGCSDDDDDPNGPSEEQGEVRVYLVDAPAAFETLNITVTEVAVHSADSDIGWVKVNDESATYNLIELRNGQIALMGQASVDTGTYDKIRIRFGSTSELVVDGESYDVDVSSNLQAGLVLDFQFEVDVDATYDMILDFDAESSIVASGIGQFSLEPDIRIIGLLDAGRIEGRVFPFESYAMITATQGTQTIRTFADMEDGRFMLMAMPEGTYVVTVTASQGNFITRTILNVEVTAQQTTQLGEIILVEDE